MRSYWIIITCLVLMAAAGLVSGFALPAMTLFTAVVAYYWATMQRNLVAGLVVCAFLAPALLTGAPGVGAIFVVAALLGVLLGALMRAQVSLGGAVTVMTLIVFSLLAIQTAATWTDSRDAWSETLAGYAEMSSSESLGGMNTHSQAIFEWLDGHWAYVSFGMLFGSVLLVMVILCTLLYRKLADQGVIRPYNRYFTRMRVPELLVWAAIALAGLWFLDNQWPNDVVRFVAWNGAIALAVVYWLNGLSIVLCILHLFKVHPFLVYGFLLSVFILNVHHVFAVIGLFDTWTDFRLKTRRYLAAKQAQKSNGSDDVT